VSAHANGDDEAQRIAHDFAGDPDCGGGRHGSSCCGLARRIRELVRVSQEQVTVLLGNRADLEAENAKLRAALADLAPSIGHYHGSFGGCRRCEIGRLLAAGRK
jgi:hypothetical protein